ncbi:hypothetical protein ACFSUP_04310 [Gracilibacillus thailandensis]|uniref:hypothetical protein n=1 Tax=Gracilibacillus thailandensis TaxID=563735 RepID=UPI00363A8865
MTENTAQEETGANQWTFECQKCDFVSHEGSEVEALNAVDAHADYGSGHFDFEITDPEGVTQYP